MVGLRDYVLSISVEDKLWCLPSLLFKWLGILYPVGEVTGHEADPFFVAPKLGLSGAVLPLHHMPS